MTYVQGFVIPAHQDNREAYRDMAAKAAPIFAEYGAQRIVETWGDDIPDGKQTDMKRAVQANPDEQIVYSWVIWPDKATCDAASEKMMADERMKPDGTPIPFDMQRMIYAGFDAVMDTGDGGAFGYVDGMVAPVPTTAKDEYLGHARMAADLFKQAGATRLVENWGTAVPDGKVTDFKRAVEAKEDETVVFSWIEWPDKQTRDAGMARIMEDPAMRNTPMPFDGKRMIFGGFVPILDTDA
ncbi:uncharacterized protein YbaA (DUF1428 family) [Hephaestia caeni]|uniref:Uncharacterized protein YbaA (DUF1428 family) n=1 Tax=Hephaestia caeni TaxID=645617 RepID=A0A397NH62_9SPHN|nr:uncharacterized protein YbaA (DUF1428 family) [Hephaestia caeni]